MTRLIFAAIAAVLIFQWTETPRTPTDSRAYLHAAQAFASGHDDPAFTQWPPGLPIVLAAFQLAGINPLHGMRWLNAACYALTVYLTLGQVTRWRVALGVALLMPFMWHIYLFVLADAPFVLLTVLMLIELPKRRLVPLALILTAAVMTKYSGLYLIVFAFLYLLRQQGLKPACMAVILPLTAFGGWYLRCYALFGKLTTTAPYARYSADANIAGVLTTFIQYGGVLCVLVLAEILVSHLRQAIRHSFSS